MAAKERFEHIRFAISEHFEHIADNAVYYMLGRRGSPCFSQQMKHAIEQAFYEKLVHLHRDEQDQVAAISKPILYRYVASAHLGLIEWWLENDLVYSPAYMADVLERLISLGPLHAAKIAVNMV